MDSLATNVQNWLELGNKILSRVSTLRVVNQKETESAPYALDKLYYEIANLTPQEIKKYVSCLNLAQGESSDLSLKSDIYNFLGLTRTLFYDSKLATISYMRKNNKLPIKVKPTTQQHTESKPIPPQEEKTKPLLDRMVLQSKVQEWDEKAQRIRRSIHLLKPDPFEKEEATAAFAFEQLYYNISNLSDADIRKYVNRLNIGQGTTGDLTFKSLVNEFIVLTKALFAEGQRLSTINYMKRNGVLPERPRKVPPRPNPQPRPVPEPRRESHSQPQPQPRPQPRREPTYKYKARNLWSRFNSSVEDICVWFFKNAVVVAEILSKAASVIVGVICAIYALVGCANDGFFAFIFYVFLGFFIWGFVKRFLIDNGLLFNIIRIPFYIIGYLFYNAYVLLAVIALLIGVILYNVNDWSFQSNKPRIVNTTSTPTRYRCTAKSSLNVRTGPTKSSRVIGSIKRNEIIEVYDFSNGFAEIRYNNSPAYVSSQYITKLD